jgi:hypothetical protein
LKAGLLPQYPFSLPFFSTLRNTTLIKWTYDHIPIKKFNQLRAFRTRYKEYFFCA